MNSLDPLKSVNRRHREISNHRIRNYVRGIVPTTLPRKAMCISSCRSTDTFDEGIPLLLTDMVAHMVGDPCQNHVGLIHLKVPQDATFFSEICEVHAPTVLQVISMQVRLVCPLPWLGQLGWLGWRLITWLIVRFWHCLFNIHRHEILRQILSSWSLS